MPSSQHPPRKQTGWPAPPAVPGVAQGFDFEDQPYYLMQTGDSAPCEYICIDDDHVWSLEEVA